ncbi:MAG: hypothetical protein QM724_01895 [Flavobacteriales bacterium]
MPSGPDHRTTAGPFKNFFRPWSGDQNVVRCSRQVDPERDPRAADLGTIQWTLVRHCAELGLPQRARIHAQLLGDVIDRLRA